MIQKAERNFHFATKISIDFPFSKFNFFGKTSKGRKMSSESKTLITEEEAQLYDRQVIFFSQ